MVNFAAPELIRDKNDQSDFDNRDCSEDRFLKGKKTVQTDVYEFGCLSYAASSSTYSPFRRLTRHSIQVFFDAVPFQGIDEFEITQLITSGNRPVRLGNPKIGDGAWNVIDYCWAPDPSKRPTMEQIVQTGMKFTSVPLLLANLGGVCIGMSEASKYSLINYSL